MRRLEGRNTVHPVPKQSEYVAHLLILFVSLKDVSGFSDQKRF